MLTTKTLAIAEALAVSVPNADVMAQVSPVVVALADNLEGVLPLQPDTYMARIPELSATSPEYGVISDEVTTALAENLRATLEQIRVYGRGVSGAISSALNQSDLMISKANLMAKNFLMGSLDLQFIRTDHPFYSSLFYPLKAPVLALSFEQVSVDELRKVRFARWEANQIQSWLNIDNPEINELLMSSNVDVTSALTGLGEAWDLPFEFDHDNNTINFTKPKMNYAETLFIQYILLSKMVAEDAPFEGLVAGGLEEYRSHIGFLHAAYQKALVELKAMVSNLVTLPIRIVENGDVALREATPVEGSKMFKRVRAKATVYYNAAGLDMCMSTGMNFSDVAVAYFYRKYLSLDPSIAAGYVNDMEGAKSYLEDLTSQVIQVARDASAIVYNSVVAQALFKFIASSPELAERFSSEGDTASIQIAVDKFMGEKSYGNQLFHLLSETKLSTEDAVFSADLPTDFLRFIGCNDACSVLGMTITLGNIDDCEVTRRENLHVAVINHFVNKLFTAE